MSNARERLEQAERRLAEVEALQQMAQQAGAELASYRAVLEQKLEWLRSNGPPPAVPVRPAAAPRTGPPASGTQRMATVKGALGPPPAPAQPAKPARARLTPPKLTRPSDFRRAPPPAPEPVEEVEELPVPAVHPASAAFAAEEDDDGSERRSAPRRKGNPVPVKVNDPLSKTEPVEGWVVDRSTGGIRILTDQSFKPGTQLSVRPAKAHAGFPWIKIEVRSCSPERGSFSLGCMFLQKPSWAELQGFG